MGQHIPGCPNVSIDGAFDLQAITNFGRNLSFSPARVFTPKSEDEVLTILDECRGRQIRVIGRLHSWSEAPVANDVLLDLRHINQVQVEQRNERP